MSEFICPKPDVETKVHVALKKRKKRGNLRDKKKDDANEREDEDDHVEEISIVDRMVELKSDQSCRTKRQKVISTLDITGLNGRAGDGVVVEKSMKEMIGSQFAIQEKDQYGGTISHENLLEKYIKEKTGQEESTSAGEVELTEEEKLYRVPQEIKDMEGRSSTAAAGDDSEGGQELSINTGISEVALPDSYKLQNIAATEEARQKQHQDKAAKWHLKRVQAKQKTLCLGNTAISYLKKIQQDDWNVQNAATEKAKQEERNLKDSQNKTGCWNKRLAAAAANRGVNVAPEGTDDTNHHPSNNRNNNNVNNRGKPAYYERSNDDKVVGKFIKSQRRFNR